MVKMQNVGQGSTADNPKLDKVNVQHDIVGNSSTPHSSTSSPAKSETETYSERPRFMSDSSESEEDSVSEVESFIIDRTELDEDPHLEKSKFLLSPDESDRSVDPETQARLEALLHAAGISQLATKDGKHLADPEVLRRLTSSVSCALDEAAAALTRMRTDNPRNSQSDKTSLVDACTDGDVCTVRKLLTEGRSVHETTEDGESLLSLACSAGYFELAQVLLAMHANVEDRGIKGECTPLMEAASAGHIDIVRLLIAHGADVNAQSTSGNTPLMYACAGGHEEAVEILLESGANVEDHNENGHTPLMEAASAGHVNVAKILLRHGAGINTHSNEFKESALTLACYKGHLDMVRFLLEAGADQEHKTDEMHTALMEASMDGHVEVARLLLDSGAQVNMPTDSFESPLTLAACGGHVDLAMLLIERGANIEEVNDEGYTPLMEAAREGHEEMVALLLSQGANINAQTDETQETALTLACCGGFSEVADFLIKAGADIELGASTPLMEAAQEGHLELVKYLLQANANVHAQTQTGDTALTYACENGHTDVADLLLECNADLEHESEGGRTPLMKACRAGHLCTVQFLISKGANVNRQTTNNDHTPLSLACAGGHLGVVELLLSHQANPFHKLKDNSTMLIEAAKGGHTSVVQLLLDYPHSILMTPSSHQQSSQPPQQQQQPSQVQPQSTSIQPTTIQQQQNQLPVSLPPTITVAAQPFLQSTAVTPPTTTTATTAVESLTCHQGLHEVPEAVRIVQQDQETGADKPNPSRIMEQLLQQPKHASGQKSLLRKNRSAGMMFDGSLTSAEAQQVRTQPLGDFSNELGISAAAIEILSKDDGSILDKGSTTGSIVEYIRARRKQFVLEDAASNSNAAAGGGGGGNGQKQQPTEEHILQKQQILEDLHRVERELQVKPPNHLVVDTFGTGQTDLPGLPLLNLDLGSHSYTPSPGLCGPNNIFITPTGITPGRPTNNLNAYYGTNTSTIKPTNQCLQQQQSIGELGNFVPSSYISPPAPLPVSGQQAPQQPQITWVQQPQQQQIQQPQTITAGSAAEVNQTTAISDRPKAKPVSKKEGKNLRKQQAYQQALQQQQHLQQINQQLHQQVLQHQQQIIEQLPAHEQQQPPQECSGGVVLATTPVMTMTPLTEQQQQQQSKVVIANAASQQNRLLPDAAADLVDLLTDQDHHLFTDDKEKLECVAQGLEATVEHVVHTLEGFSLEDVANVAAAEQEKLQMAINAGLQVQPFSSNLDDTINAIAAAHSSMQVGSTTQSEIARVEYFAVPSTNTQLPTLQVGHGTTTGLQLQYEQYLQSVADNEQGAMYQAGFQAGLQLCQEMHMSKTSQPLVAGPQYAQQQVQQQQIQQQPQQQQQQQQQQQSQPPQQQQQPPPSQHQICTAHQVQVATQTQQPPATVVSSTDGKKQAKSTPTTTSTSTTSSEIVKVKKGRLLMQRQQPPNHLAQVSQQNGGQYPPAQTQNFQIDPNTVAQYNAGQQYSTGTVVQTPYLLDVDSKTDSNHDTALTLACAGGHEDLVELLLQRGADIEHRDKKGFTPLILAATAGHEKVVEILLNNNADIEAQSERTKDTPLSLACSGGRYEVVDLLLSRGANREHRNVSDYTPLSLAASGGYVNIIKLLLSHGAEINSRTGSKLGISPLMLAAMNGHTAAVKLLLDMGSDINAQIETNRNTALTLACFQGRHEVVSLLLDRKANVEHRAKTGLTPLMEAASGGYVEVGRVLLDKGADVNATPVPSSRDTALTIAADKGHCRFVELLLSRGAAVEVKNKKGNSPLWLAANGGHLSVVELLYNAHADIDSQDNRKVSCLMAAFRKGHTKVVKWMVNHVTQFPSDQEMIRYISTVSDKELLEKCQECVKIIRAAKETQAAKANKNASILLEELDMEKNREESKKAAAARRRERKKKKKLEKKEEKRKLFEENRKNENYDDKDDKKSADEVDKQDEEEASGETTPGGESPLRNGDPVDKEEGDSGIDANSQGSCSSNDVKAKEKRKDKKKKKKSDEMETNQASSIRASNLSKSHSSSSTNDGKERLTNERRGTSVEPTSSSNQHTELTTSSVKTRNSNLNLTNNNNNTSSSQSNRKGLLVFESSRHPAERDEFEATGNETYVSAKGKKAFTMHYENDVMNVKVGSSTSPKQTGKREEGWKEVTRKSSVQTVSSSDAGTKKISVPLNAISRVIGRGGSNINAIRGATGAHIEVEKQSKGQGERIITIKGSTEATKQAHSLIGALIKDPDVDILQMLPKTTKTVIASSLWDKTNAALSIKKNPKIVSVSHAIPIQTIQSKSVITSSTTVTRSQLKMTTTYSPSVTRGTAPRLVAAAEKRVAAQLAANTKNTMSYTTAIMTSGRGSGVASSKVVTTNAAPALVMTQTFAAKLTDNNTATFVTQVHQQHPSTSGGGSVTNSSLHQQVQQTQISTNKPRTTQSLTVPYSSVTAPTSPQASTVAQCVTTNPNIGSPKHHRPLPTASAPPSIPQYQTPGKAPFSSHNASQSSNDALQQSNSAPAVPSSSGAAAQQQQSNPAQSHSSDPGLSTTNHVLPQQQTTVTTSTPQEYSLFNDSFTKVTQQSMWGRENDHKINFAAVTGGGGGGGMNQTNSGIPTKFIDNDPPPQADASKAPGYRGNAASSPVSSKTSSNSTTPPSSMPLAPGTGYHNFPDQNKQMPPPLSGMNLNRPVSRPGLEMPQTSPLDLNPNHYVNRNPVYQEMPVRSSADNSNLYKNSNYNQPEQTTTNLLKMVPPPETPQHNLIFHQPMMHHQNFSQPPSNNQTTVSMSRLNPRAPDFSLHNIANKTPQQQQQQPMFNNPNYHHSNVISQQNSAPNPAMGGSSNVPYPLKSSIGTYHNPPTRIANTASNQNRWQFMNAGGYHQQQQQQQQQQDIMVQMNNMGHLRGLNLNHPQMDLLENGGVMNAVSNSPAMSPNSPAGHLGPANDGHHKMEDRKMPQPIGIERAWKIQNSNVVIPPPAADNTDMNWILGNESKIAMGSWNSSCLAPNMERQPQQQQQPQFYRSSYRMPAGDDISHMMDTYGQHGGSQLDNNQHVFQNGTVTAMGLMPPSAVPPLNLQQYGPVTAQDIIQTAAAAAAAAAVAADPMKIGEMPQWDGGRMGGVTDIQDKHSWTAKWSQ